MLACFRSFFQQCLPPVENHSVSTQSGQLQITVYAPDREITVHVNYDGNTTIADMKKFLNEGSNLAVGEQKVYLFDTLQDFDFDTAQVLDDSFKLNKVAAHQSISVYIAKNAT